jgi:hypothetical protein
MRAMANIGDPLRRVKIIPLRTPVRGPEPSSPVRKPVPVPEKVDA